MRRASVRLVATVPTVTKPRPFTLPVDRIRVICWTPLWVVPLDGLERVLFGLEPSHGRVLCFLGIEKIHVGVVQRHVVPSNVEHNALALLASGKSVLGNFEVLSFTKRGFHENLASKTSTVFDPAVCKTPRCWDIEKETKVQGGYSVTCKKKEHVQPFQHQQVQT